MFSQVQLERTIIFVHYNTIMIYSNEKHSQNTRSHISMYYMYLSLNIYRVITERIIYRRAYTHFLSLLHT